MNITKLIANVITISLICAILNYLHNKPRIKMNVQDERNYIVKIPPELKLISLVAFLFGIALYLEFGVIYLSGNPTVKAGHLWFSLAFAGFGLLLMAWSVRWQVIVQNGQLEVRRLLHTRKSYPISEIDRAELGPKEHIYIYSAGKKIVTVYFFAENYEALVITLIAYGKLC